MTRTRPVCVIVDAWSTGRFLPTGFAAAGWDCVHVRSLREPPVALRASVVDHPYRDEIVHDGDLRRTLSLLARHEPRHVLAGTESGVELADALANGAGLPGNDVRRSAARRDKYLMLETIRAASLRAADQRLSGEPDDIARWAAERDTWPIVVKPRASSATDNVSVCETVADVRRAAEIVIRSDDFLGRPNDMALAQEYLDGVEHIVNTVSWDGCHHVTDIWRCRKQRRGSAQLYDLEELLPLEGSEQASMVSYTAAVLDTLGIRYGPAHTELVLTDRGPSLLEVGARLHGSIDPAAVAACVDHDQVAATVLAYTRPDDFRAVCGRPYRLRQHSICVLLVSPGRGRLTCLPGYEELRALRSYQSSMFSARIGDFIEDTVNFITCPGMVYLAHPDSRIVWQDYQRVRDLEATTLFKIESPAIDEHV
jgi:biotin carboxylase